MNRARSILRSTGRATGSDYGQAGIALVTGVIASCQHNSLAWMILALALALSGGVVATP